MRIYLVLPLAASLLVGCASLSKNECLHADWKIIGMEDGGKGHGLGRLGDHRKACSRVGVAPDLAAYEAGHAQGIARYCTPMRGYALGNGGSAYPDVCPANLEDEFRRSYQDGREMYEARVRVEQLDVAVSNIHQRIVELEALIEEREQYLVSDASTSSTRRATLERIRGLRQDVSALVDQRFATEYEKSFALEDYQALQHYHRQLGY